MGFSPSSTGNITFQGDISGTPTATSIGTGKVTTAKVANGAITATQLATGAVTASGIAASTITSTQLATGAVTTAKLAAGAVTLTELDATAQTSLRSRSTHTGTQTISTITSLQTSLDGLAPLVHTHDTGDISGLDAELNAKVDNSPYWVPIVIRAVGSTGTTGIPAGFPIGGIVFTRQS